MIGASSSRERARVRLGALFRPVPVVWWRVWAIVLHFTAARHMWAALVGGAGRARESVDVSAIDTLNP